MNAMVKALYLSAFLFFRASLSLSSFCTGDEGGEWESQLSFVFAFCDFIEVAGLVGRYDKQTSPASARHFNFHPYP